jgi:hypothetical protein
VLRGDFGVDRGVSDATDGAGPGAYLPSGASQPPAVALPRAARPDIWAGLIRTAPDPGQYDPHDTRERIERRATLRITNPAFKDRALRDSLTNRQPNPGPAAYFARPAIGTGGVKQFAKGNRFTDRNFVGPQPMNEAPGPGTYNTADPIELEVRKKPVKTRPREQKEWGLLAFGQVKERTRTLKTHLVRFGNGGFIGCAPPPKVKESDVPGPAKYQDGSRCEMIKPSASVLFDPEQQPIAKFDL